MKRLALVLAAALLGTGCIFVDDDECDRTLTLQWDFMDWDGQVRGCTAAARQPVQSVDVWVDRGDGSAPRFVTSFGCFEQVGTIALAQGDRFVTVEGISGGAIAYRHDFAVSATCGDQLVAVRPAQGTGTLAYTETVGCPAATTCYLWFSLRDDVTGEIVAGAGANGNQTLYPYSEFDPAFVLPEGPYTLEWMQLVSQSFVERARTCSEVLFDVVRAQNTPAPVPLRDSTLTCP